VSTFDDVLRTCHGVLVDDLDEREVGVVDDVDLDQEVLARELVVISGWGRRTCRFSRSQIADVESRLRRLVVRPQEGD
jgi:hypothetical protein